MKNQRFWVALFVVIPLALAVGAWLSARRGPAFGAAWQPVKIASFNVRQMPDKSLGHIEAGRDYVVSETYVFDLQTKRGRSWTMGGLTDGSAAVWEIIDNRTNRLSNPQLEVRDDAGTARYDLPDSYEFDVTLSGWSGAEVYSREGEIAMLTDRNFYRWKKNRPALVNAINFSQTGDGRAGLSRDWSRILCANFSAILIHSTKDGRRLQRINSPSISNADYLNLTAYGEYAFYSDPARAASDEAVHFDVLDAPSARVLWGFDLEDARLHGAISPDATRIAVPLPSRALWQVRRLADGSPVRSLPLVPGATSAAFSPDNGTLYSVAGGVLYRQRAR